MFFPKQKESLKPIKYDPKFHNRGLLVENLPTKFFFLTLYLQVDSRLRFFLHPLTNKTVLKQPCLQITPER